MIANQTIGNFFYHTFAGIGDAEVAMIGGKAIINIDDAVLFLKKDIDHLLTWIDANGIDIFYCIEVDGTRRLRAMFFDEFIDFCLHERDVTDNPYATIFLINLAKEFQNEPI